MAGREDGDTAVGVAAVLDIGGDVGALLVRLGDVPESGELEAEPVGRPDGRFHTGVHLRLVDGRPTPCALFPNVRAGTYHLLDEDGTAVATVDVAGGAVRELSLGTEPEGLRQPAHQRAG